MRLFARILHDPPFVIPQAGILRARPSFQASISGEGFPAAGRGTIFRFGVSASIPPPQAHEKRKMVPTAFRKGSDHRHRLTRFSLRPRAGFLRGDRTAGPSRRGLEKKNGKRHRRLPHQQGVSRRFRRGCEFQPAIAGWCSTARSHIQSCSPWDWCWRP